MVRSGSKWPQGVISASFRDFDHLQTGVRNATFDPKKATETKNGPYTTLQVRDSTYQTHILQAKDDQKWLKMAGRRDFSIIS